MAIVQSYGTLQRSPTGVSVESTRNGPSLWVPGCSTYAEIYRTQPMVRTVIDYIARSIADVGLHVYRRVSDTDRKRLVDHELADWLEHPNPDTTEYTLKERLFQDLGIYGMAFWLKVRLRTRIGLVRIAPESLTPVGWLLPSAYIWTLPDGQVRELRVKDVVAFRYFNPDDPLVGLSRLETLRQLLAEHAASIGYRAAYWRNAARLEGIVERPATAPKWTTEQKASWRDQWNATYSGAAPGKVAVLEDGMVFKPTAHSARDSEFTLVRKLTDEEVARAFHVPLPMVGILDHATFSNIREQHKHLYQDCLGPELTFLCSEIERQLLPECDDQRKVYVEANIAEKLKGSFEEQAAAMQTAIGRPWMTANEGRARLNLPAVKDDESADKLALPMNMAGAIAPEEPKPEAAPQAPVPAKRAELPAEGTEEARQAIRGSWARQAARLARLPAAARPGAFDLARWDRELTEDLEGAGVPHDEASALAAQINGDTLERLFNGREAFPEDREASYV